MISQLGHGLDLIPDPEAIQYRLGELVREEQLLRRLLRLAVKAREERRRRDPHAQHCHGAAYAD